MKPRLQTSLGQQLVLTPQLRQAIRLLQMSGPELDAELAEAVESNPLLDWAEPASGDGGSTPEHGGGEDAEPAGDGESRAPADAEPWTGASGSWSGSDDGDAAERVAEVESLHDHLLWQLRLGPLGPRELRIAEALVDAIDDDGYLREPLDAIADGLAPEIVAAGAEVQAVLHQLQQCDPPGVGARDLGECLALQLGLLPAETPGHALALRIAREALERVPRAGAEGLATEFRCPATEVEEALALLRSLDPRPGAAIGGIPGDTYIAPDCVIWREQGTWRTALAGDHASRLTIHRGYAGMIGAASEADAGYLRGRLQEARWLLKNLEQRGETLLRVVDCLVREQAAFLEFGDQALRPLTLREVATVLGVHESTVSRAVARKYVRTPRGTMPLRAFFASGVDIAGGGGASSTAIQAMIRTLVDAEDPRKPLSDARLAELLKAGGIPVARRTVAKYREALNIPSSHDRVRLA
jgi:RNA polymerase sigma-54 factor